MARTDNADYELLDVYVFNELKSLSPEQQYHTETSAAGLVVASNNDELMTEIDHSSSLQPLTLTQS